MASAVLWARKHSWNLRTFAWISGSETRSAKKTFGLGFPRFEVAAACPCRSDSQRFGGTWSPSKPVKAVWVWDVFLVLVALISSLGDWPAAAGRTRPAAFAESVRLLRLSVPPSPDLRGRPAAAPALRQRSHF